MHPDIKKFWENAGYQIDTDFYLVADIPWYLYWFILKDDNQVRCVGVSDVQPARNTPEYRKQPKDYSPPCTMYYWDEKKYTEEEMLKIIKMKAFL